MNKFIKYAPHVIAAICGIEIVTSLLLHTETMSWVLAFAGWTAVATKTFDVE